MSLPHSISNNNAFASEEPTAKAHLQIDLLPGTSITSETSGPKADKLVRTLAKSGTEFAISVTPAITTYAVRGYLSSTQSMVVIMLQLAAIIFKRAEGTRTKPRNRVAKRK